jgi:hypothetical protein
VEEPSTGSACGAKHALAMIVSAVSLLISARDFRIVAPPNPLSDCSAFAPTAAPTKIGSPMPVAPRSAVLAVALAVAAAGGIAASPTATATPSPTTVFVATHGHDGAVGSRSAPLATIQAAVKRLPDGGTVEVRGGRYYQRIDLTGARRLTVRSYGHEHVILDGSRFTAPQGSSALVTIRDASFVQVGGLDITGYRTKTLDAVPIGISVGGHDDHVSIVGNHVHDLGNDNGTLGSYDINAHGVAVYGDDPEQPITQLSITRNEVDHLALGASESVVVNGNVDGWAVTRNSVHDNNNIGIDAIGFESTLPAKYRYTSINRARNGVIADNQVSRIRSQGNPSYYADGGYCNCADGIYVDGGTHITIQHNTVTANDIGIEVAAENARGSADHINVLANDISLSRYVGIATGGYCDSGQDCGGVSTGSSFDNSFVGNTLTANNQLGDGSPEILIQYFTHDDLFARNKITAKGSTAGIYGSPVRAATDGLSGHNTSDDNSFHVVGTSTAPFSWLGRTYGTFAAYQRATGQDRHSTFDRRNRL